MSRYRMARHGEFWRIDKRRWVWKSWLPHREWEEFGVYADFVDAAIALEISRLMRL